MDYRKFCEIIQKGENQNVDFKIMCNAFMQKSEKDTIELIKDIIAFSNNGFTTNYIVIGVSDDGNSFKSFDNPKLTDDNLQVLVKDYIHPIPKVKLKIYDWVENANDKHKGKSFCVIQVGPHSKQCFRLIQEKISYQEGYCFKKFEVWIRRQATSSLATPEEIRGLVEGHIQNTEEPSENNIKYDRMSRHEYEDAINGDFVEFLPNIGAQAVDTNSSYNNLYIDVEYFEVKIRLAVIIEEKCVGKGQVTKIAKAIPKLHHGSIILSTHNITRAAFEWCPVKMKESWGYFTGNYQTPMEEYTKANYPECETFSLVISNISDTEALQKRIADAFKCIKEKEDIRKIINMIHNKISSRIIEKINSDDLTIKSLGTFYVNGRYLSYTEGPNVSQEDIKEFLEHTV